MDGGVVLLRHDAGIVVLRVDRAPCRGDVVARRNLAIDHVIGVVDRQIVILTLPYTERIVRIVVRVLEEIALKDGGRRGSVRIREHPCAVELRGHRRTKDRVADRADEPILLGVRVLGEGERRTRQIGVRLAHNEGQAARYHHLFDLLLRRHRIRRGFERQDEEERAGKGAEKRAAEHDDLLSVVLN